MKRPGLLAALAVTLAACASPRSNDARQTRAFPYSRAAGTDAAGFYDEPVGLCDDYPEETTTSAKIQRDFAAVAATGARVLRFGMGWDGIEERSGHYDFRFWDEIIGTAERLGVTVIPYLCYTPEWAGSGAEDAWRKPPRNLEAFGRFAGVVAERYRGRVRSWELWNEPDTEDYWRGSPEDFARMVTFAAQQVRRADPEALVVLGGMARGRGAFSEAVLERLDAGRHFDAFNLHGYLETWSTEPAEGYPGRVDAMSAILPRRAKGPDLWLAEMGYSDRQSTPGAPGSGYTHAVYDYEHTPEYQAESLIKHHVLARAGGRLSLTAWYRINNLPLTEGVIGDDHNRHLGILDVNGAPKPSFWAMRLVSRLFDQPVRSIDARIHVERPAGSQSEVHAFERRDGKVLVFGWLRSPIAESAEPGKLLADTRRETVTIALPDRGRRTLTVLDAKGDTTTAAARLDRGTIGGVELRGDRVFIATIGR
ncbi:MAG: cellulase family glycosylhydrolase [Minicystis sp.]